MAPEMLSLRVMETQKTSERLARRALQVQRGGARAAVLGVNDGLVSVLCIVLAVAGAGSASHDVLIAGLAGLLAGAVSMAAGEWISVQAQVELFGGIIKDIQKLARKDRQVLIDQMVEDFSQKGQQADTATAAAEQIAADDKDLIQEYARHIMGFNPEELGSPWVAAGSSFALFSVGALVPLLPWLAGGGDLSVWVSIVCTAMGGLIVGGYIGWSSGKSITYGALRQLGIIILAAAATYGVGYLFGVSVA
jgi:VIT1/CCC1 family predicted Fe2+/Mn2+ transporter